MIWVRIPPRWQLPESQVTAEQHWLNRRRFLQQFAGAGLAASIAPIAGCQDLKDYATPDLGLSNTRLLAAQRNPAIAPPLPDRPITHEQLAFSYNNYYEFGRGKAIWQAAQALPTDPWQVEVTGLVQHPLTLDLDDLYTQFPLEERIYRFRCVEAWAMVVPWIGFPMSALLKRVEPKPQAKFVRFTSFFDREISLGPKWLFKPVPWPYQEGLRLEEMANELAFFAVGLYGRTLPKQNGAPIRMVIPWKYGFKGAKSIIKIEFVAQQPATFWNTLIPEEYGFEANVNPQIPHPRWSQATERLMGSQSTLNWQERPTLLYNGYADYVSHLY